MKCHTLFTICGKNHQTKTRARSTRLCLEENQKKKKKKKSDPPYVCPKLQVQATFYCQHLLLRNWFHFPFLKSHFPLLTGSTNRIDFLVFFGNKALLGKTNHIRFLVLPIPIYVQNIKEIDFSTSAAECSMVTESRS